MTAIKIRGLVKRYKDRAAVNGIDLDIEEGELFALLGTNGAGKTTTIKMLCGLTPPTSGDADILGDSVVSATEKVKAKLNVSPQETAIGQKLTVRENLELIARVYGSDKREASARTSELMADFNLTERANDRAKALSGGLQRRLSIAMALISKPQVVFLDEPTLGLDVRARHDLWKVLQKLKGKITIVLTTHYLEEAEVLSDRIAILHEGKVIELGTSKELEEKTGTSSLEDAFLKLTDMEEMEAQEL